MGVDYDGVGGVGIEVTPELVVTAITKGLFTQQEWENDKEQCIEAFGLPYAQAGNCYSREADALYYYLFVEGSTLGEVYRNAPAFVEKLREYGIKMESDDLKIIVDGIVW